MNIPAALNCDSYKTSHYRQYSPHTQIVYSTWTPRKSRMEGVNEVVFFGLQYFIKDYLIESFNNTFFNRPKDEVINEIKTTMKYHTGDVNTRHWEQLHDLGYLPLKISAVEEGTLVPIRCPMFTIENTKPEFYWLTNFIESVMSTEIWKPMTSATIALQYRKILDKYAEKTCDNNNHVDYQGHDFSYRGMAGCDGGLSSGAGHLLSFKGTDTIPAILWLQKYYNANPEDGIGCSIPATEHSVAETNIIELEEITKDKKEAEKLYIKRLLNIYKNETFSYVSDTYNLWEVLKDILPSLKEDIMSREGTFVIRPDSGDPCDIICGLNSKHKGFMTNAIEGKRLKHEGSQYIDQQMRGVIELLWDTFGGTINEKGYKVLDPHVGCIYGDAITLERAEEICSRLESKGFASSNIVLGIGSYTYNMNTRDTFGFALKTTYGMVNDKELMLYKDPITDDGTKKSQKGMVSVVEKDGIITYIDNLNKHDKLAYIDTKQDLLQPVFVDGKLIKEVTLKEIRKKLLNANSTKD
ncbi:MAG: nicotinate phosphoribosyltransferase [Intestinibacter sp.]